MCTDSPCLWLCLSPFVAMHLCPTTERHGSATTVVASTQCSLQSVVDISSLPETSLAIVPWKQASPKLKPVFRAEKAQRDFLPGGDLMLGDSYYEAKHRATPELCVADKPGPR